MTNDSIFDNFNMFTLMHEVSHGYRPEFKAPIPKCYKHLIRRCWSENAKERPTFEYITHDLMINPCYITENVDKDEYMNYVDLISEMEIKMNDQTPYFNIDQFLMDFKPDVKSKKSPVDLNLVIEEEVVNEYDDDNQVFLDLSKFEKMKIINKDIFTKTYKLKDKETEKFYLGQVSMMKINKITEDNLVSLSNEIKIIKEMNHPNLLKFVGYSQFDFKKHRKPVIVTEFDSKVTLNDIIEIERTSQEIQGWNDTKKLIVMYGIASGLSIYTQKELSIDLSIRQVSFLMTF